MNADVRLAILLKGVYRLFYIANWIYRSIQQIRFRHHFLVYAAGVVQVVTYADFFLYHVK